MNKIKYKKAKRELLYFTNDGSRKYFYKEVEGYTFQATLKEGSEIELFIYKCDQDKGYWHVNDSLAPEACLTVGNEHKTRIAAANSILERLSSIECIKYQNALNILTDKKVKRLKQYTLKVKAG